MFLLVTPRPSCVSCPPVSPRLQKTEVCASSPVLSSSCNDRGQGSISHSSSRTLCANKETSTFTNLFCPVLFRYRRSDHLQTAQMSNPDPFQGLVDSLKRVLLHQAPSSAPPPSPPVTSSRTSNTSSPIIVASPMVRPAPYSGSAKECNGFILQCNLTFEMQPLLYPTDSSKVAFIISLLAGPALQWAETIWAQSGPIVQSLQNFMIHFREVFGKVDGDTSVGEQLYHFQQGSTSIAEYSLKFRTLAAASGWNERSLLTTYRLGLEPRLRLQLAAYDDTCGIEKFIQLSVRCSDRMQSCFAVPQIATSNAFLRQPEPFHPPEPATEPMIIDRQRISSAERQRRLTQGLCLYCGAQGHIILACPLRPPRPVVSAILPKIVKMEPLTTCVTITASNVSIAVSAILNSGSAGNFISRALCRQLSLQATTTETIYQVQSITGKPLSRRHVRHRVGPITLRIGLFHTEDIHLLLLDGSTADIILGRPWLVQHNPILSWKTGEVLKWGKYCFPGCFPVTPSPLKTATKVIPVNSTTIEEPSGNQSMDIPACYAPFRDVFCPKQASRLPPHWPWDSAIDLIPGEPVPCGKIYPLSLPEQKAMEEYVKEALDQGYIRPSSSPAASSFFFVTKRAEVYDPV